MGRRLVEGAVVLCLMASVGAVLSGCGGCASGEGVMAQVGEGRMVVAQVEVHGEGLEWGPDDEMVRAWFEGAVRSSERGIRMEGAGQAVRARVHHRMMVVERPRGAVLRIDVDVQLEPVVMAPEPKGGALKTTVNYRHPFAVGRPSMEILDPLGRTLTREVVEKAVRELREQAVVRQSLEGELHRAIRDEKQGQAARLLAIDRAVEQGVVEAEEALKEAAKSEDLAVAVAAAQGLVRLDAPSASATLLEVAQRMSRDRHYEEYEVLLPLLAGCEEPWIGLYLETVAEAHRLGRIRKRARELLERGAVRGEDRGLVERPESTR